MTRPFVLGIDCRFYIMKPDTRDPANGVPSQYNKATHDTWAGLFNLVETVRDVTLNLTSATADITSRAARGWRQMVSALKEASVDTSVIWAPDDVNFSELLTAYDDQCPITCVILDGPIQNWSSANPTTGEVARCGAEGIVTGLYADFMVTEFSRGEPLEEAVTADITIQPAKGAIYPEWLTLFAPDPPP